MNSEKLYEIIKNIDEQAEAPDTEPERQYYFIKRLTPLIENLSLTVHHRPTFHIETFGCQMNAKDSEKLAGILEVIGCESIDNEKADFVLYNTCTVRENANLKVYGRVGYLGKLKEKNPHMFIALCGCMMQEKHVVEKIKSSYRFVDLVFGTHNLYEFPELLYKKLSGSVNSTLVEIFDGSDRIVEELPTQQKFGFKAGVNIMYGCNNFCTFCIVPYVRGREKSRQPEMIIKEVKELAEGGVKEIMLLGQNVDSYGNDNPDITLGFAGLLKELSKVDGIKRIRFMSPHPKDFTDDIIDEIASNPVICKHVHLPLQSGSSRVLKKMNRHYTREDFIALVDKIKSKIDGVAVTTDIIVGFPGETEEDFTETLEVMEKCEFSSAYTFQYSKRTGTRAATMPDQVPENVVGERFERLLELQRKISDKLANELTGSIAEVLVEEYSEEKETLTGRLNNNLLVHFKGCKEMLGELVNVKLDECKGFYYIGSLTE